MRMLLRGPHFWTTRTRLGTDVWEGMLGTINISQKPALRDGTRWVNARPRGCFLISGGGGRQRRDWPPKLQDLCEQRACGLFIESRPSVPSSLWLREEAGRFGAGGTGVRAPRTVQG